MRVMVYGTPADTLDEKLGFLGSTMLQCLMLFYDNLMETFETE